MSRKQTRNFGDVIRTKLAADPKLAQEVREAACHGEIARQVYRLRRDAGLSQKELAERTDTHQSVISRIEDDDYEGHALSLLLRIAFAFGKELKISFVDPPPRYAADLTEQMRIQWKPKWTSTQSWQARVNIGRPEVLERLTAQVFPGTNLICS